MSKKTLIYGVLGIVLAGAMFAAAPRALACTSGCPGIPKVPTFHMPEPPRISTHEWKPTPIKTISSTVVEQHVSQETNVKVEVKGNNNSNDHHNDHNDHKDHKKVEKVTKIVKVVKELPVTGPSILGLAGLIILAILIAVGIKKSYQVKSAK
ncbi:MAG: hypothetical protein P4L62_03095 [Candidatus Pacebacteria bacterium]|nr:hypothetical protein [Candidatus Paceibacterota bacterium]MDR3583319.1 hypothetical protein [Candidatus Paceibacterota bacterium]